MKKKLIRLEDLQVNNYYTMSRNKKLSHIIKVKAKTKDNVEWYECNLSTQTEFKKMIIRNKDYSIIESFL